MQLLGWAAFGTFLIVKGAWLTTQSEPSSGGSYAAPAPAYSYGAPHYYQNGRALHPATLTEEFGGGENELDPLNYTIPYMDKYLVMAMAGVLAVTFQLYKIPHSSCEFTLHDAHCVDKYLLSFPFYFQSR